MKPLSYSFFAFIFFTPIFLTAQCTDLFFSEYIEGSSFNKAVEVYNASDSSINLSDYEIHLFSNGATSANSTISLSGSLGSDSVYVVANGSAGLPGIVNNADQTTGAVNFNGNDALALINTTINDTLDILGVIGQNTNWSISGTNATNGSTQDHTLVRDPLIQNGQKNWSIGSTEWIVLPNNEDDSIGFHQSVCNSITGFSAHIQIDSNVRCFGLANGGLSAIPIGGDPPYQYLWSTNDTSSFIDSLGVGIYRLTITDANNDSAIVTDTISQPPLLTVSLSKSDVFCFGEFTGSINSSVNGGSTPYSYLWNDSLTAANRSNLAVGTYTLSLTDRNGCIAIDSATINQRPEIIISLYDTNIRCNGSTDGIIAAGISGGTPNFNFSWSNQTSGSGDTSIISNLSSGTYTITVTDALGCTKINSTTISEPSPLLATITIDSNVSTFGGSDGGLTAGAIGGVSPYEFNWSTSDTTASITGLSAASYRVTVTDSNTCSAQDSATISQPPGPVAELIITEIMYNPPETGSDSLEFIEIINASLDTINLSNYTFRSGVNYTFGNFIIPPSEYVVGAVDSSAFRTVFGFDADYIWSSGALSNGGEAITLIDQFGRVVDSVNYSNSSPWPSGSGAGEPNGGGASIELNANLLDNAIGSNWSASTNLVASQVINGSQVYASPGAPNSIIISIDELNSNDPQFRLFPNPSAGQLNIELNSFDKKLPFELINTSGKVISQGWISAKKSVFTIGDLRSGLYFFRLGNETQKLIVSPK